MTTRVEQMLNSKLGGVTSRLEALERNPSVSTGKKGREEEAFWVARRSLRFAPVRGEDLKAGVEDYVKNELEAVVPTPYSCCTA